MFLRNLWYFGLPGERLKPGRTFARTLLGEQVLIGRDLDGKPFALHDFCPHRAMPLRHGSFDGREIECCYHGWRFDTQGRCTAIPSLAEGSRVHVERIRTRSYPCREVQGNIWVYFGDGEPSEPPIELPTGGDHRPALVEEMVFDCTLDDAVVGLMDPAHGPFVHRAWWWRSRRSIHEKAKAFEPAPLGFCMVRHAPSRNSAAYRLLGGEMSTEITFRLPGLRVEDIRAGRHRLVGLTAVTPVDATHTRISHTIYWTMPWLGLLKPVLRPFARAFLNQDRVVVEKQREGLVGDPQLILIDDADTQAKWYYRLKKEFAQAEAEDRPFRNPVEPRVLHWRS